MINDKDFNKLIDILNYKSPLIELNNNYKNINLYSSLNIGDYEYEYYILENNLDNFKTINNNFIKSLENIKNLIDKEFKIEDVFKLKQYLEDFINNKNKFSRVFKLINPHVLNKEIVLEKTDILYRITKDLNVKSKIENLNNLYQEFNLKFSEEYYNFTINSLSDFISKISLLEFNTKGILYSIQNNYRNNDNYEENNQIEFNVKDNNKIYKEINDMFNDQNNFLNEFIDEKFKDAKIFRDFLDFKDKIYNAYNDIYISFKEEQKLYTCSDMIVNLKKENVADFIKVKTFEKEKIELTGLKYSSIEIFEDNSLLLTKRNGELSSASDTKSFYHAITDVLKNELSYKLKKYPTIAKKFIEVINSNYKNINTAKSSINTFLNNKGILKANNFDIVSYIEKYDIISDPLKNKFFENLDDEMNSLIKIHKVKNFAESIISNKYINLYNEDSYKIFSEILDSNVNTIQLQNLIGKKIALYNNSEEFNEGLKEVLDRINGFYLDIYLEKIKEQNAKIISSENNVLIIQVENFEQSKNLGSTSWCISRDKQYFDSYTSDNQNQFFIYDFNLESTDENSMIGMTLNKNNDIYVCYSKFDEEIRTDTAEISKYQRIIENKLDENKFKEEMLKNLNEKNLSRMRDFMNNQ